MKKGVTTLTILVVVIVAILSLVLAMNFLFSQGYLVGLQSLVCSTLTRTSALLRGIIVKQLWVFYWAIFAIFSAVVLAHAAGCASNPFSAAICIAGYLGAVAGFSSLMMGFFTTIPFTTCATPLIEVDDADILKERVAESALDCWNMYGEGGYDPLTGIEPPNPRICYTIKFNLDGEDVTLEGLESYIRGTYVSGVAGECAELECDYEEEECINTDGCIWNDRGVVETCSATNPNCLQYNDQDTCENNFCKWESNPTYYERMFKNYEFSTFDQPAALGYLYVSGGDFDMIKRGGSSEAHEEGIIYVAYADDHPFSKWGSGPCQVYDNPGLEGVDRIYLCYSKGFGEAEEETELRKPGLQCTLDLSSESCIVSSSGTPVKLQRCVSYEEARLTELCDGIPADFAAMTNIESVQVNSQTIYTETDADGNTYVDREWCEQNGFLGEPGLCINTNTPFCSDKKWMAADCHTSYECANPEEGSDEWRISYFEDDEIVTYTIEEATQEAVPSQTDTIGPRRAIDRVNWYAIHQELDKEACLNE